MPLRILVSSLVSYEWVLSLLTGVMPASRLSFSDMMTCVEFQGCVANVLESPTLQVSISPIYESTHDIPDDLLCLVRDDLDVVQEHLTRHVSALGTKREHAAEAVLQVLLRVLVVHVLLEACNGTGQNLSCDKH